MTAAVAGTDAGHSDEPLHACSIHGVDQNAGGFRKEACAFEDESGRKVDTKRLDDCVDVLERRRLGGRCGSCRDLARRPTAYRGPHQRSVCPRLNVPGHARCSRLEGQSALFQARCRDCRRSREFLSQTFRRYSYSLPHLDHSCRYIAAFEFGHKVVSLPRNPSRLIASSKSEAEAGEKG